MTKRLIKPFIIIETTIYMLFMILDILNINTTVIKYLGIITCFIYTLINKKKYGRIALFFTCLADLFLLVLDRYYIVGVLLFVVVQCTYILYLDSIKINTYLLLRIVVPLVVVIVISFVDMYSLLNVFSIFYFSQLVISALSLVNKKHKLLCIGLCLFMCCDICVGLHNVLSFNKIIALGQWFFYLPSQVLISIELE